MKNKNKKTLLLVEDELLIAMAKQMELEKYGYNVLIAKTGEDAVALTKKNRDIDLILMDIDLGKGIDGIEAAEQILIEIEIPIAFLSSHTEPEIVEKTERITSYGYIVKNSNITVLDASIKMAFKLFNANHSLKLSEKKFRIAFETSSDAININDMDGGYVNINEGFTKLTGYSEEDVIGIAPSEINIWAIPSSRDKFLAILREKGTVENLESVFRCKDGSLITVLMSANILVIKNKPHIFSIYRDITDRIQIEDENKQYKHIVSSFTDMTAFIDSNYEFVVVNEAYAKAFNLTPEDFTRKSVVNIFGEKIFLDTLKPLIDRCFSGETFSQENWYEYPSHGRLYIETTHFPYHGDDNDRVGCVVIVRNITAQKKLHDKLVQSEANLSSLINNRNNSIWSIDKDYKYVIFNKFYKDVYFSLFNIELKTGMNALDVLSMDKKKLWKSKYDEALAGNEVSLEFLSEVDGSLHPFECFFYPIIENNKISGVAAIGTDITRRIQDEQYIKDQLEEKEIILKETHHRIKNNFATIVSLLSLQSNTLSNSEAISALKDAIGRVKSMEILYDKLLLTHNYKTTSIKIYLNNLIDDLIEFFPEGLNIRLDRKIDDFQLDSKQLVPVGIIINELLTNIVKYAFTDRDSGLVDVVLKETEGNVILTVKDDGRGFPEGFDIDESNGFGLFLIKMLVKQLEGSLSIENCGGLKTVIQFSI